MKKIIIFYEKTLWAISPKGKHKQNKHKLNSHQNVLFYASPSRINGSSI